MIRRMSHTGVTPGTDRPPRRRPRQAERRAQTRARLLKAAGKVFARHGYERATLDAIAEEAGLSKGAVYYNFASKEELFLALLEERLVGQFEGVERAFEQTAPPERQSEVAAQLFLESLERDARWAPLFFEFVAYCARDPGRRAHFAERFLHTARQLLSRVIERRYNQLGVDPPMRPDELAICIDSLANGIVIERLFDPESVPDDLLGRAVALLTRPSG
jgi:AcrR family transcriptional regulator